MTRPSIDAGSVSDVSSGEIDDHGARIPTWKRIARASRSVVALAAVLVVAVAFDVWMRVGVLPWFRRGSRRWHREWSRIVRSWGVWTFRLARVGLGMKVEVDGEVPADGRFLVVANHQSSIDIPALIDVLRPLDLKFVAHDGLAQGKPAVSLALRHAGFAVVHKKNRLQDLRTLRRFARETAHNHGSPAIFPEGQRSFDGEIRSFHVGGLHALREASGLAVLPVVHDGLWRARTVGEVSRLVGTTLRFRILEPIPASTFERSRREAYASLESTLREALRTLRRSDVDP